MGSVQSVTPMSNMYKNKKIAEMGNGVRIIMSCCVFHEYGSHSVGPISPDYVNCGLLYLNSGFCHMLCMWAIGLYSVVHQV